MQNLVSLDLTARNREIWQVFPLYDQCKTCDPRGGAKFYPRAIIWALLVESHKIKLHAKFGKPRPHGYIQGES